MILDCFSLSKLLLRILPSEVRDWFAPSSLSTLCVIGLGALECFTERNSFVTAFREGNSLLKFVGSKVIIFCPDPWFLDPYFSGWSSLELWLNYILVDSRRSKIGFSIIKYVGRSEQVRSTAPSSFPSLMLLMHLRASSVSPTAPLWQSMYGQSRMTRFPKAASSKGVWIDGFFFVRAW